MNKTLSALTIAGASALALPALAASHAGAAPMAPASGAMTNDGKAAAPAPAASGAMTKEAADDAKAKAKTKAPEPMKKGATTGY